MTTKFNAVGLPGVPDPDPEDTKLPALNKAFVFGGIAHFAVANPDGRTLEYLVRRRSKTTDRHFVYYVSVQVESFAKAFRFVGILERNGVLVPVGKSEFLPTSLEFDVAEWALHSVVNSQQIGLGYDIYHVGQCGYCGTALGGSSSTGVGDGFHHQCWDAYLQEMEAASV